MLPETRYLLQFYVCVRSNKRVMFAVAVVAGGAAQSMRADRINESIEVVSRESAKLDQLVSPNLRTRPTRRSHSGVATAVRSWGFPAHGWSIVPRKPGSDKIEPGLLGRFDLIAAVGVRTMPVTSTKKPA